ncbi:MAG: TylF/MycF/NovP-related O-methyltransferase [Enterobacterales bacterium]|nr:TylF/MycF/NovP-related O-methyltransferase [Enterobacterales bacterium]
MSNIEQERIDSANNTAQLNAYKIESSANDQQIHARNKLHQMFQQSPLPDHDLMFNLGLYTRSSVLVKFLVMDRIYQKIKNIPGHIMEFGVWWGQNLVLMENLRAIHEPFNKQRKIIGFDTFSGYDFKANNSQNKVDKPSEVWEKGSYSTSQNYIDYLQSLIQTHEANNVLGHQTGLHQLVAGDVAKSVPKYFDDNPATMVALAYFDIGLYKPTVEALKTIKPHLMPGSIILLDELTWQESPGEAIAFKEVFEKHEYEIEKVDIYPSKSIVTIL